MARDFHCGLKIAVYVGTVDVRRVAEREGVNNFPRALSRKASVHAATFSHFRHIGPSNGWVGHRRGVETAPGLGCLPRGGRLPTGPAWPQPAAPPMHRPAAQAVGSRLARAKLDLGRGRRMRGGCDRMHIRAKGLSDRNTYFIYDTDEHGSVKSRLAPPRRELEFGRAGLRPRPDGA